MDKYSERRIALMKRLKLLSNIFLIISVVSLAVGTSFHGYRIHPEHAETYNLGVTMGIAMIIAFAVFLCAGIVCRIIAKKAQK